MVVSGLAAVGNLGKGAGSLSPYLHTNNPRGKGGTMSYGKDLDR